MIIQKIRLMLSFSKVVKMLVAFIVGAILIGRPDLPMKAMLYLQIEAVKGLNSDWGCPRIFKGQKSCRRQ